MPGDLTYWQRYHGHTPIDVTILVGTPGYSNAVAGLSGSLTYIQRITLSITTHVSGDRYLFDDDGDGSSPVAAHTDAAAGAGVLSTVLWDFGPTGRPLKAGANLDVSHSGAGVAVAHIEGYYQPQASSAAAWTAPLSYSEQVIADGAVGYWRLGEASGTVAVDSTATPLNGTYVGTPSLGEVGALSDGNTAVLFDGVDDVVTNAAAELQVTAGPFSVEAWAKRVGSSSDAGIVGRNEAGSITWHVGATIFFYAGSTNISFAITDTTTYHHIVGTWDGTTAANGVKLYVDGVLRSQGTSASTVAATAALTIGDAFATSFNGYIDEVALYSTVLTLAQIREHYKARL
jgi:hypothetical protein